MKKTVIFCRIGFLILAIAFLAVGVLRTHKIYEAESDFGVMVFQRVPESALVEFATFSGVYRHEGQLILHEWAKKRDGKQKCLT